MPDKKPKIKLNFEVENIGPHSGDKKIHFQQDVNSLEAIFYASNGTGKSFVSRAFRLLSSDKSGYVPDDMLTLGQTSASLVLDIADGATNKKLSISLHKGNKPTIQNNTGYLFHVFNNEYVEENIKSSEYTPDGNIDGYILGKIHIDLTTEKDQEKQLIKDIEYKGKEIDSIIHAAQKELRSHGIRPVQNEYSLISKEKLCILQHVTCDNSFDEIISLLRVLEKMPDNLPDIVPPSIQADISILNQVQTVLSTAFPKSDWDEEFAARIKIKRSFIEQGIDLTDSKNTCPFCEQPLREHALSLIQRYKMFLSDKETQTIRMIDGLTQNVQQIALAIEDIVQKTEIEKAKVIELIKYFPSLKDAALMIPDASSEVLSYLDHLVDLLNSKSANISSTDYDVTSELARIRKLVEYINKTCATNAEIARRINSTKNDSNAERLKLRRELCNAQYLRIYDQLAPIFKLIAKMTSDLGKLRESIKVKEEQGRVSKKDRVYETLDYFMNRFFAGKYTIDKDTFFIRFLGATHPKASHILSDGEKSIIAFCYYMASTHLLIERDDDYNKLFFVIDDPISSMDFNFVYGVAQSFRDIKKVFGIARVRLFLFTHNLEFYSIITRNHTITQAYVMRPGKIEPLKKQLLMPYENHLYDIVVIANGQTKPSHTTGNSIRHVLETVSRFEYPEKKLEKYITEQSVLKDNSCIFTLCQDLSHGAMRSQPPFDEQVLTEACNVVVIFMRERYHGQIDAINGDNYTGG